MDHVSGTTPTLDVKLQTSPDGTAWADLPNGAFTQVTTSDSNQALRIENSGAQVRVVVDVGAAGSPNYNVKVTLVGPRLSPPLTRARESGPQNRTQSNVRAVAHVASGVPSC